MNALGLLGFGAQGLVAGSPAALLQRVGALGGGPLATAVSIGGVAAAVVGAVVQHATAARVGNVWGDPQHRWVVAEHDYGWVHVKYYDAAADARAVFDGGHLRRMLVDTAQPRGQREVGHLGHAAHVDDAIRTVLRQLHVL